MMGKAYRAKGGLQHRTNMCEICLGAPCRRSIDLELHCIVSVW